MRTLVANELNIKEKGSLGFEGLTASCLMGKITGFVGSKEDGIDAIIPLFASHIKAKSGRILYDGTELGQKGGDIKMPIEAFLQYQVEPGIGFLERMFSPVKITKSRVDMVLKYFPEFNASILKKYKDGKPEDVALHNICSYIGYSQHCFLLDRPFTYIPKDKQENVMKLIRESVDRFKDIFAISYQENDVDISVFDVVYELKSGNEVFNKAEAEKQEGQEALS